MKPCNLYDIRAFLNDAIREPDTVNKDSNIVADPENINFQEFPFHFDSRFAVNMDSSNGSITWHIADLHKSFPLEQCSQMELHAFQFPKIFTPNGTPEYLYNRRMYVEIANLLQGVEASNNMKYHYECKIENPNGHAVDVVPLSRKSCLFNVPITSLNEFTVNFYRPSMGLNPLERIYVPQSSLTAVLIPGTNPARFTLSESVTKTLAQPGVLPLPGIAVYFTSFANTGSTQFDNNVTGEFGHYVTNIINDTTFEVGGLDASGTTFATYGQIYVPKNRIVLGVRFTVLQQNDSNHVTFVRSN